MDFNCRLTGFTLFKDFIKSEGKPNTEDNTLMFDIDAIKIILLASLQKKRLISLKIYMELYL